MPETPEYLLSLCQQAANLDFGLLIESDNITPLREGIYQAIKSTGLTTEDLDIQICIPSTPNTLYILRRSAELPE